jgi:hypothetical protein
VINRPSFLVKCKSENSKGPVIEVDPVVIKDRIMKAATSEDACFARTGLCSWFS